MLTLMTSLVDRIGLFFTGVCVLLGFILLCMAIYFLVYAFTSGVLAAIFHFKKQDSGQVKESTHGEGR